MMIVAGRQAGQIPPGLAAAGNTAGMISRPGPGASLAMDSSLTGAGGNQNLSQMAAFISFTRFLRWLPTLCAAYWASRTKPCPALLESVYHPVITPCWLMLRGAVPWDCPVPAPGALKVVMAPVAERTKP